MSCPHTQTTVVLAAFGEAPTNFDDHLLSCAECRAAMAEHRDTLSAIAPALLTASAPKRQRSWRFGVVSALLAATALLSFQLFNSPTDGRRAMADSPIDARFGTQVDWTTPFDVSFDDDLSTLEMELALLEME